MTRRRVVAMYGRNFLGRIIFKAFLCQNVASGKHFWHCAYGPEDQFGQEFTCRTRKHAEEWSRDFLMTGALELEYRP